jgi:hypothetical protein
MSTAKMAPTGQSPDGTSRTSIIDRWTWATSVRSAVRDRDATTWWSRTRTVSGRSDWLDTDGFSCRPHRTRGPETDGVETAGRHHDRGSVASRFERSVRQ